MVAPRQGDALGTKATKHPVWRLIALALLFLVTVPLQFVFENSETVLENVHKPGWVEQTASLFHSRFAYIPRPLEARYVALLSISEESEGALPGPCVVRSFLLKLLVPLVATGPALIVSDIALAGDDASDTCPASAPETQDLAAKIIAAARTTPLVIGQASWGLDELPETHVAQLRKQGFGPNDLLLRMPIALKPRPKNVSFGLIRLNQDFQKVPVVWFSHQSESSGAEPRPALGLAAAEMYRSTFPNGVSRLKSLEATRYHPVTALLGESSFTVVPAIRVICDAQVANHDWRHCVASKGDSNITAQLHGRIVVLGFSDHANDLWNTNVGRMAGYVLHANYIEALLDARAYQPLSFWLTCLLSALWLALVEVPFWIPRLSVTKALIFSAGVSIIFLFLANYVALVNFGLYITLFVPGVLLIAVLAIHGVAERLREKEVEA
jgi:hypothetical protein